MSDLGDTCAQLLLVHSKMSMKQEHYILQSLDSFEIVESHEDIPFMDLIKKIITSNDFDV